MAIAEEEAVLHRVDDESQSSESAEDQYPPPYSTPVLPRSLMDNTPSYHHNSALIFMLTKIGLIISTTAILILLPLYEKVINVDGNAYSMVLMTSIFSVCFFFLTLLAFQHCSAELDHVIPIKKLPLNFTKLGLLTAIYVTSGFTIIYALDRKRVMCHLQDPIKGMMLICSLLYSFVFCNKLMRIQQIIFTIIIIAGICISVDYSLCNEYRCRGYEKTEKIDDGGSWTWQTHSTWTIIYMMGLAIFTSFFTLLERYLLIDERNWHTQDLNHTVSPLCTVSNSVNSSCDSLLIPNQPSQSSQTRWKSPNFILRLLFWLHLLSLALVLSLFWTSMIPSIGKGSGFTEGLDQTLNGLLCHFKVSADDCKSVALISWTFIFFYLIFSSTVITFVILSQSAVYTVATMSVSLPIIGIWWSVVYFDPDKFALVIWGPTASVEMISSTVGLFTILFSLWFWCRSYFKGDQLSQMIRSNGYNGDTG